jgi:hypothetical protein
MLSASCVALSLIAAFVTMKVKAQATGTCPTVISEGCPPSATCTSVCAGARCLAWENSTIVPRCCSYACSGTGCFAKWFDATGNALNCDPCAGALCANRAAIEANCATQFGADGFELVPADPAATPRRCCVTCKQKAATPATCPTVISEGCPPSATCTSACTGARCLAWENQTSIVPRCCSYACSGTGCFAKWFDATGNALNCDPCAGALCANRTAIEANCATQFGADGFELVPADPAATPRRCCVTCKQKAATPATCPTVISEGCPPSATCTSACTGARCLAWENQTSIVPRCCSYACSGTGTGCFAKWFDATGNALNCDPCAGALCANRTAIEANCATQFGADGFELVPADPAATPRRCCVTCKQKEVTVTMTTTTATATATEISTSSISETAPLTTTTMTTTTTNAVVDVTTNDSPSPAGRIAVASTSVAFSVLALAQL